MFPFLVPETLLITYELLPLEPASHLPSDPQPEPLSATLTSFAEVVAVLPIAPPASASDPPDTVAVQLRLKNVQPLSETTALLTMCIVPSNGVAPVKINSLGSVVVVTVEQPVQFDQVSEVTKASISCSFSLPVKTVTSDSHVTGSDPKSTALGEWAWMTRSVPHKAALGHKVVCSLQNTVFKTLAEAELAPKNAIANMATSAARPNILVIFTVSPSPAHSAPGLVFGAGARRLRAWARRRGTQERGGLSELLSAQASPSWLAFLCAFSLCDSIDTKQELDSQGNYFLTYRPFH